MEDLKATAENVTFKAAVTNFKDSAEGMFRTYYKLGVATVTKKGADAAAAAVSGILMAVTGLLGFLFAFIGLAFWLGTLVNSTAGGFLIVAGFFILLMVLVMALKAKVIFPMIRNIIVKKVYEEHNNKAHQNV
jgi:hypothetical protein